MNQQIAVDDALGLFVPGSAGSPEGLATLTKLAISQTIPFLSMLVESCQTGRVQKMDVTAFCSLADFGNATDFKALCDQYGSDKARSHNYHYLYAPILKARDKVAAVLEIGMGTNNTDVVSNMGQHGRPGASLRAFRDFLPNALIFGADVDRRILFEEDRIKTFFVDQTDLDSFQVLGAGIPPAMDLIIDDGLHAPNANLAVLLFGLKRLKVGGWLVVEDIPPQAIPLWEVVSAVLPATFKPYLIRTAAAMVFAVEHSG
jgi:hypothetical protein